MKILVGIDSCVQYFYFCLFPLPFTLIPFPTSAPQVNAGRVPCICVYVPSLGVRVSVRVYLHEYPYTCPSDNQWSTIEKEWKSRIDLRGTSIYVTLERSMFRFTKENAGFVCLSVVTSLSQTYLSRSLGHFIFYPSFWIPLYQWPSPFLRYFSIYLPLPFSSLSPLLYLFFHSPAPLSFLVRHFFFLFRGNTFLDHHKFITINICLLKTSLATRTPPALGQACVAFFPSTAT